MHATDIVGYQYQAEIVCPRCIIGRLVDDALAAPAARDMGVEAALDQIAGAMAIERGDETTFDSWEFPKVVFRSDVADETCGNPWCPEYGDEAIFAAEMAAERRHGIR